MNKRAIFFLFLSVLAGLNLGSIRRTEDPIRDTQTNPILYEQKKEEEKDGKKGPLLYHVMNNPREDFFIDPPYEKDKEIRTGLLAGEAPVAAGAMDWWEEQPSVPQEPAPLEAPAGPVPEPLPGESEAQPLENAEGPQPAATEAGIPPAAKGDDYWW